MKQVNIKRIISLVWFFSGASYIYRIYKKLQGAVYCPIMTYHSIADDENRYLNVKKNEFIRQINYLKNNFNIISINQLVEFIQDKKMPPRNSAIVVFDDGYKDNIILKEASIPATVFLATDYIGKENYFDCLAGWPNKKMLSWDDILELKSAGCDFGSHACSHSFLSSLESSAITEELRNSKSIIEEQVMIAVSGLAYPGGKRDNFDDRTIKATKEAGYKYACSTIWSTYNSVNNLFALRRISINYEDDLLDFKLKLRGWYDWISFAQNMKYYVRKIMSVCFSPV